MVLIITHVVSAQITDDWDQSSRVTLRSGDSHLVITKGDAGIRMRSNADAKDVRGLRIIPFQSAADTGSLKECKIGEGDDGLIEVHVTFSNDRGEIEATIRVDEAGELHIKPARNCDGIAVHAPIDFVVQPGRILDDVIIDPANYPDTARLHIPSENLLMGLLAGQDRLLIGDWPPGSQRVRLQAANGTHRGKSFCAIEIDLDGKSLHLGLMSSPRIWHRQPLQSSWLEKEVEIPWQRPFDAKWKTHLFERGELETAYAIRKEKGGFWRAGLGTSKYPIWFDGDLTYIRLSKKFPAKQPIFIYPFEDHDLTPTAFVAQCLGDVSTLRTHQRIAFPDSITGMYPCDGHDYITRMFRLGLQNRETHFLHQGLEDLLGRTRSMENRLQEYHDFIVAMGVKLESWRQQSSAQVRSFLDEMADDLDELRMIHTEQMGEMTAEEFLKYQIETMQRAQSLLNESGTEVYPEAAFLIEENYQAAALTEHVGLRVGGRARRWAQEAIWRGAANQEAVPYAAEIRKDIRDHLGKSTWHEGVW